MKFAPVLNFLFFQFLLLLVVDVSKVFIVEANDSNENSSTSLKKEQRNNSESDRSFEVRYYGASDSVRLLDYFKNKRKDPQCNPVTNVYPCGALEFLGCSGIKKFYSQAIIKLTWFEAWEFCRSNGMHLASIESNYEQVFMELFLPKPAAGATEGYWLSGNDLGRQGLFFWMTNGHSFTFTNWRPGEPNNVKGQEHCVQMTATTTDHDSMRWSDMPCNVLGFVVCQEEYLESEKLPDRIAPQYKQEDLET